MMNFINFLDRNKKLNVFICKDLLTFRTGVVILDVKRSLHFLRR